MIRCDAYIEKNWELIGITFVLVCRTRDDGLTDVGAFLVDLYCLGVKDAFFEAEMSKAELDTLLIERLPEEFRERIHPACAKKLIEGAIDYAETLGFAPHRDYRKARKVLSSLDAAACPREFTYGCDGRPCYVRGLNDSEERTDRILAILDARLGPDGFDYEDPEVDDDLDDAQAVREELIEFLDAEPETVPRFYETSGLITAMLLCPTVLTPLKIMDELWGKEGRVWADQEEAQDFSELLMAYWNQVNDLVLNAIAPDATPDDKIFDVWLEDFPDENDEANKSMMVATCAWAIGFHRATQLLPDAWGDALTRPDLAPHWEVVGWWTDFEKKENRDKMIAAAESDQPRTLNAAVTALARALRSSGPNPF